MNDIRLPVIPETIRVHLGPPSSNAATVTVPFADYIKNVASSEIYPTWPENALRANILAEITFALNRIYTEYYPSRGYDFDITNSTAVDQSYTYGRDVFENVSNIVDEIFNTYIRRRGNVEPIFSLYCNGTTTTCPGLSQWGSVSLANGGLSPVEILRRYYGNDIELVENAPISGNTESYPGRALRVGSAGDDVRFVQVRLNRISKNYPAIPKINPVDGIFANDTEAAVRRFQEIFNLPVSGTVDRATWYAILRYYAAVKGLSDLNSEGISPSEVTNLFATELSRGFRGVGVRELQYFLQFVSFFDPAVAAPAIDGIFGPETENAVKSYQAEYGLPETGVVNTQTWESLYNTYRTLIESLPEGYFSETTEPYPGYPIRRGSTGDAVRRVQTYLSRISDIYTQIPKIAADGIFGPATESAVLAYQNLFGFPPTGIVGSAVYNSIADTYRSIADGSLTVPSQYNGEISMEG